jgi:hypothetical protein
MHACIMILTNIVYMQKKVNIANIRIKRDILSFYISGWIAVKRDGIVFIEAIMGLALLCL